MYEEMKGKYLKHLDFIILDAFMLQLAFLLSYISEYRGACSHNIDEIYVTFGMSTFI